MWFPYRSSHFCLRTLNCDLLYFRRKALGRTISRIQRVLSRGGLSQSRSTSASPRLIEAMPNRTSSDRSWALSNVTVVERYHFFLGVSCDGLTLRRHMISDQTSGTIRRVLRTRHACVYRHWLCRLQRAWLLRLHSMQGLRRILMRPVLKTSSWAL